MFYKREKMILKSDEKFFFNFLKKDLIFKIKVSPNSGHIISRKRI